MPGKVRYISLCRSAVDPATHVIVETKRRVTCYAGVVHIVNEPADCGIVFIVRSRLLVGSEVMNMAACGHVLPSRTLCEKITVVFPYYFVDILSASISLYSG